MSYSKRQRVIDAITEKIDNGTYAPGSKLPSATELRAAFDVSQQTIRDAMTYLKAVGKVVGVAGSGIYVAKTPPAAGSE